jgi:hypothetical protein
MPEEGELIPEEPESDADCLVDLSTLLQFLGSVFIIINQIIQIRLYLQYQLALPTYFPHELPGVYFILYLLSIAIIVGLFSAGMLFITTFVTLKRSAAIGGLLAIVFAIPALFVTGLIGITGAVLAIIAGIIGLLSAIRPPKPQRVKQEAEPD